MAKAAARAEEDERVRVVRQARLDAKADADAKAKAVAQARLDARAEVEARAKATNQARLDAKAEADALAKLGAQTRNDTPVRRLGDKELSAPRTVVFYTSPPSAHIRLTSSAGKAYEANRPGNPAVFTVPAGVYSWSAELGGYLPDGSGPKNSVDVVSRLTDTLRLTLTQAGDVVSRYETAGVAYKEDRCSQAIMIYKTIEAPVDLSGTVGRTWLESRGRLAQCQRKLRQYDDAIATYRQVLAVEPYQWNAKYELGGTYCDKHEFKSGTDVLRELSGPYLNRVQQDRRLAVQAMARYGRAICHLSDYRSQPNADNHPELREPVVSLLDEFMFTAERELKNDLPSEIRNMLANAFNDAKNKRAELKGS